MKDKYVWWGILGVGVAALFWFLTSKQISQQGANTVTVPYLVPTTGASPGAGPSLSNQPNIVGSTPNSTIPNFTNPAGVASNPFEAPNTWGFMPNLPISQPVGPNNNLSSGMFSTLPVPSGKTWIGEQIQQPSAGSGGSTQFPQLV
jgi:hypothetical protein